MTIFFVLLGFILGVASTAGIGCLLALPRSPEPPPCTAVLQSGEICRKSLGHDGPHHTVIYQGYSQQQYVWNDVTNGLHPRGFFTR
jgi:hypothetical protein